MIFNFDFVEISSLAGFSSWGEFDSMDSMVDKLEKLRLKDQLHAINHTVLMTGFVKTGCVSKKTGCYRLSFINGVWVVLLNIPKTATKNKGKK